jgi:hypothetical protein
MEPVVTNESAENPVVEWQAEVAVWNIFGSLAFVFGLVLFARAGHERIGRRK